MSTISGGNLANPHLNPRPADFVPLPDVPEMADAGFEDRTFPTASYAVRLWFRNNRAKLRAFLESDRGLLTPRPKTATRKAVGTSQAASQKTAPSSAVAETETVALGVGASGPYLTDPGDPNAIAVYPINNPRHPEPVTD